MAAGHVKVTDAVIRTMLSDPRFREAIPCINSAGQQRAPQKRRCGRCRRRQANTAANTAVLHCLATMPKSQRETLKSLLNASRVIFPSTQGAKTRNLFF